MLRHAWASCAMLPLPACLLSRNRSLSSRPRPSLYAPKRANRLGTPNKAARLLGAAGLLVRAVPSCVRTSAGLFSLPGSVRGMPCLSGRRRCSRGELPDELQLAACQRKRPPFSSAHRCVPHWRYGVYRPAFAAHFRNLRGDLQRTEIASSTGTLPRFCSSRGPAHLV